MAGTWRDSARPIIQAVIDQVGTDDERRLKNALRHAYPFGERKYWPYKVWLDEIQVRLGNREFGGRKYKEDPKQLKLF